MTLKDALGFTIDYGKFIVTLWSSYIALIVAMIGWLLTLRSKGMPVDGKAQTALIIAFVCVSVIFFSVLYMNNWQLTELMKVVDTLAKIDGKTLAALKAAEGIDVVGIYGRVFDSRLMATAIGWTTWFVVPVAGLVCWFMWSLTKSDDPVTKKPHRK